MEAAVGEGTPFGDKVSSRSLSAWSLGGVVTSPDFPFRLSLRPIFLMQSPSVNLMS